MQRGKKIIGCIFRKIPLTEIIYFKISYRYISLLNTKELAYSSQQSFQNLSPFKILRRKKSETKEKKITVS